MSAQTFFVCELVEGSGKLSQCVQFKHPFLSNPMVGWTETDEAIRSLYVALDCEVVATRRFDGEGSSAILWRARGTQGEIQGVSVVLTNYLSEVVEVAIYLRPFQLLTGWKQRCQRMVPHANWDSHVKPEPLGTYDPLQELDARLPMPLTPDARFDGPVFVRQVQGAQRIERVLGHARSIYGAYEAGPLLRSDLYALRTLSAEMPLDMVSVLHSAPGGRLDSISVFARPWERAQQFLVAMSARLGSELDRSYFEAASDVPEGLSQRNNYD